MDSSAPVGADDEEAMMMMLFEELAQGRMPQGIPPALT